MMNLVEVMNPLADLGCELWRHGAVHAYRTQEPFRWALTVAWPLVALPVAAAGLMVFRRIRACADLATTRPQGFRRAHSPYVVPLALLLGGVGLSLIAPGYIQGMGAYRPGWWPNLGGISAGSAFQTMSWSLVVGVAAAGLMLFRAGRDGKNHERGSARWAKWSGVSTVAGFRWSIPIRVSYRGALGAWGSEAGLTVLAPSEATVCRHVLVLGQTGSGKGFSVFEPILASSRAPVVYQDIKGQCPGYELVKARFGREPIRWGCAARGGLPSMGWNPMEECRRDAQPEDAFAALAAALIPRKDSSQEDWVSDLTRPILAHVLQHGGYAALADLQDALMSQGVDRVLEVAAVPKGLLLALDGKNIREYLGTTLFTALSPFRSGWGREVTSHHDFSLEDVCKTSTYVLSAEPEATRRAPLTVFWTLLLRRLLQSSEPVPLTLLFDEALAAGKIPFLRDALVTLRDRRVSIVFGTQHLSGVREVYGPTDGESLIASFTSRIVLLNGLDARDREWLVKSLGQRVVKEKQGKTTTTVTVPLMTLDDLNRRASTEGAYWAVIDGAGMSRTGEPIMARMVGGPKGLVRRLSQAEPGTKTPQLQVPMAPSLEPQTAPGIDLDEL